MATVVKSDENVEPDENWRDRICPRRLTHDGFEYIRKNVNTRSVLYYCIHCCRGGKDNECKAIVKFSRNKFTGLMEPLGFLQEGDHTRQCCVINGHDPNEYHWDGKTTKDQNECHSLTLTPQSLLHRAESMPVLRQHFLSSLVKRPLMPSLLGKQTKKRMKTHLL